MDTPATVYLSGQACADILLETTEHFATETGGVLLGHVEADSWYVAEALDPGPNAIRTHAYFEYNHKYLTHLAKKIARRYKTPLRVLGLWHRHPGSLDVFSGTDDQTNTLYVQRCGGPVISGLVNIDPDFRLTFYRVECPPLRYAPVEYRVGDGFFPPGLLDRWDADALGHRLNVRSRDHREHGATARAAHRWIKAPRWLTSLAPSSVKGPEPEREEAAQGTTEGRPTGPAGPANGSGTIPRLFVHGADEPSHVSADEVRSVADPSGPGDGPDRAPAGAPRALGVLDPTVPSEPTVPTLLPDPARRQLAALDMLDTEMAELQGLSRYTSSMVLVPEGVELVVTRGAADGRLPQSFGFVLSVEGDRQYVQSDSGKLDYSPGAIRSELERLDRPAALCQSVIKF